MAQQGKKLDEADQKRIARMREVASVRKTARELDVDTKTVQKYANKREAQDAELAAIQRREKKL